jgi:hypothetical protein
MKKQDREVVENLSEPAKRLFYALDHRSQRRLLKQAEEIAGEKIKKQKSKERLKRKSLPKKESKKQKNKKQTGSISAGRRDAAFCMSESKEMMIFAMNFLLLGESRSEETYSSHASGKENEMSGFLRPVSGAAGKTVGKSVSHLQGSIRANVQRQKCASLNAHQKKQGGQAAGQSAKGAVRGMEKAAKSVSETVTSVIHAAANPVVWIALLVILLIGMIAGVVAVVIGSGSAADSGNSSTYQAQVSEQTESYRDLVTTYCEKYGIDDYVDLCLAMIEQESSGNPPDVMQTEQSYYNVSPPIDTAEESIDCGTHELADCLKKAGCKNPSAGRIKRKQQGNG